MSDTSSPVAPSRPDWMKAVLFDGKGGAEVVPDAVGRTEFTLATPKSFVLVYGHSRSPEFKDWLLKAVGEPDTDLMLGGASKARTIPLEDHVILMLSLTRDSEGNDVDDRHFMALYVEAQRVIIATEMKVFDTLNISRWQRSHHAPRSPGDLVARLGLRAADRMEPVIERLGDQIDKIEETITPSNIVESRRSLAASRHNIIGLRRLIWPQRDVLDTLEIEDLAFLSSRDRTRLHEASSRFERLGSELQALSERAALVHEQILDTRSEQMNRTMLVLTASTVILLPLTVISGILGMNVEGIPFAKSPHAFTIVVVIMALIGGGLFLFMKRLKWL